MEKVRYMISDAANIVNVESHVLRYWEDELELNVPRNELGHRYYTKENIQEFQRIKELKEQGYQLKAIRMIVHNMSPDAQAEVGTAHPGDKTGSAPGCMHCRMKKSVKAEQQSGAQVTRIQDGYAAKAGSACRFESIHRFRQKYATYLRSMRTRVSLTTPIKWRSSPS